MPKRRSQEEFFKQIERRLDKIDNSLKILAAMKTDATTRHKEKFPSLFDLDRVTNKAGICNKDCAANNCKLQKRNKCWTQASKILRGRNLMKRIPYTKIKLSKMSRKDLLILCGNMKINPFSLPSTNTSHLVAAIFDAQKNYVQGEMKNE